MPVFFEPFLHLEGGHATSTSRGDGLAIAAVLNVSAGEDARDWLAVVRGEHISLRDDVAVGVKIKLPIEHLCIGDVADAKKHELDGQLGPFAGDHVAELETLNVLLLNAEDLLDYGTGKEFDIRVSNGALQHDAAGAKVFAAIDESNLFGKARQKERLFHCRVAAADHRDLLSGGEEAIAGSAGTDTVADQGLLAREIQPARAGARSDDQCPRVDRVPAGTQVEHVRVLGEIDRDEVSHYKLGSEPRRLLLHVLDQFGSLYAIRPAWKIFDQRRNGELAAGLVPFQEERLKVGAGCVNGCGQA